LVLAKNKVTHCTHLLSCQTSGQ